MHFLKYEFENKSIYIFIERIIAYNLVPNLTKSTTSYLNLNFKN